MDYERRQSAQAHFEQPQPSEHTRTGSSLPITYAGTEKREPSIAYSLPVCKKTEGSN
jgi:hypothetical protein